MNISIYLEGRRLTLFKDENVNVTSKATDINNIGKVFSDFSQSFTVPADSNNNAIFQHFYDVDIYSTFNSNIRVNCYIELDTIPFKFGKMQLEGITLKNKQPDTYKVTFYGNVKQLDDRFKDDEISVLNLSGYTHGYSYNNIKQGLTGTTLSEGDIIYPLIGNNVWQYGTADINDISINGGAIDFKELKPAIRVKSLIDAIELKYGLTFKSKFFERSPFRNLFLWCSRGKENMVTNSVEQLANFTGQGTVGNVDCTINTSAETINWLAKKNPGPGFDNSTGYTLNTKVIPAAGYEGVPYKVRIYNNGIKKSETDFNTGSQSLVTISSNLNFANTQYSISVTIEAAFEFQYTVQHSMSRRVYTDFPFGSSFTTGTVTSAVGSIASNVQIANQLPAIKVKDFLAGLFKMYNLVIKPISLNEFYIEPYDDYLADGDTFDITPYVDIETIQVDRPKIFSELQFKYQKAEAILNRRYRKLFDSKDEYGYGDLRGTYEIDNKAELKIELPFELMMFERLQVRYPNANEGLLTNLHIGSTIDEKQEPIATKPILFYYNGIEDHREFPFKLGNGSTKETINFCNMISNFDDKFQTQLAFGLPWGNTINTYTYDDTPVSLYEDFWAKYIESIYDLRQRKFSYSAVLPPSIINRLSINDKLIINDQRYKIEDYTLNLTNGETKLNLSKDIYEFQYGDRLSSDGFTVTQADKIYSFQILTKEDWTVSKVAISGGTTSWVTIESETSGTGNSWVTFKVDNQPNLGSVGRQMLIVVNINGTDYNFLVQQDGFV